MMKQLVSVIIPVYNSEKYIGACIESFLKQTYDAYEIVLIDDGSKDASYRVMETYRKKYPDRIRIFRQENQGVAVTRNRGIQYAQGTYIMFADNDDYVEQDYLRRMVAVIDNTGADMVVCSSRKVDESGKVLYEQRMTDDPWSKFRMVTPWGRIVRRDFLLEKQIVFGDFKLGEDSYFTVTAYNETDKVVTIPYIGYNWVQHPTSVSNTVQKKGAASPIPFLEALIARNKTMKYISEDYFEYFVVKFIVWNLYYICGSLSHSELREYNKKYFEWLESKYPDFRGNRQISFFRPEGEERAVRWLVRLMAKSPAWVRMGILRATAMLKRHFTLK